MKIFSVQIKNFRCYRDETIFFDNYNCLVGPNGAGKSTVLMALNVFFRNTDAPTDVVTLSEEDFHNKDTSVPIEITVSFHELSDDAKSDLKAYVRQDRLVVKSRATWDPSAQSAEVRQIGSREVISEFAPYFKADENKASAAELKEIFRKLRDSFSDVGPATTKDTMRDALREYEEQHPELCNPLESTNQFYGWSNGVNLLGRYVQWVYLPAVKDPAGEQDEQRNSALGKLLQRSVRSKVDFSEPVNELRREASRRYQDLLQQQNEVLRALGKTLQDSLRIWAHPGARVELNWHYDEKKSVTVSDPFARVAVGEGQFLGEIARAGHGIQRSFLVALLQVLAEIDEENSPTLVLGFEEPELYQHPPQAKYLASVLEELSSQKTQLVLTTHSPYFVSSKGYEAIRLARIPHGQSACSVSAVSYQELAQCLGQALGEIAPTISEVIAAVEQIMRPSQNEMFFCKLPVFVEGPEDVALIATWLQAKGHWPNFRRSGAHFVVCEGKTNMSRPLAIAKLFGLPHFVVFDGDCDKAVGDNAAAHIRDNQCLLALLEADVQPLVEECFFGDRVVMWRTRIMDEIRDEIGAEIWDAAEARARQALNVQQGVRRKNPILVAATVEQLIENGTELPKLDRLGDRFFQYSARVL